MALAPFLYPGDVVVDLQTTLPGQEMSAHEQIVEGRDANQPQKLGDRLRDDRVLQEVRLHRLEDVVHEAEEVVHRVRRHGVGLQQLAQEPIVLDRDEARQRLRLDDGRHDHLDQLLLQRLHPGVVDVELETLEVVLDDLQQTFVLVVVRLLRLVPVLGQEHERQHLVHVRQPERARVDGVVAFVLHHLLLDRLHDVGQETLRLLHVSVVPHLRRDQVDEVGWEQDFLLHRRRYRAGRGDFQVPDETDGDLVVERLLLGQHVIELELDAVGHGVERPGKLLLLLLLRAVADSGDRRRPRVVRAREPLVVDPFVAGAAPFRFLRRDEVDQAVGQRRRGRAVDRLDLGRRCVPGQVELILQLGELLP